MKYDASITCGIPAGKYKVWIGRKEDDQRGRKCSAAVQIMWYNSYIIMNNDIKGKCISTE
jgi:hypothetical protein